MRPPTMGPTPAPHPLLPAPTQHLRETHQDEVCLVGGQHQHGHVVLGQRVRSLGPGDLGGLSACTAAPLGDDTFSTSHVASATCRNSDGAALWGKGHRPGQSLQGRPRPASLSEPYGQLPTRSGQVWRLSCSSSPKFCS